jgi:large subunit ribosomal protein L15
MKLDQAKTLGLKNQRPWRVGRGVGSGNGKTSGRGHKGAKSRSGYSQRIGWEGGQMPLYRRIPKRGFNNKNFKKVFTVVNVELLEGFSEGSVVDLAAILAAGLATREKGSDMLKILGNGELTKRLTVRADKFSAVAKAKIEKAGGIADTIDGAGSAPASAAGSPAEVTGSGESGDVG